MGKCTRCDEILEKGKRFCTSCSAPVDADKHDADPLISDEPDDKDTADAARPAVSQDEGAPVRSKAAPRPDKIAPASRRTQTGKRKRRRIKKRFFVFIALLLFLPASVVALFIFQPWKTSASAKSDPFLGHWTATRVDYMEREYTAAQLFPDGIPTLTVTKRRVMLSFSGSTGKGKRRTDGSTISFPCLGKTYQASLSSNVLSMDMNGMTIRFSQTQEEPDAVSDTGNAAGEDRMVGIWTAEAYTSKEHGPGYASDLFKSGCTITFQADGTGTIRADTYSESITWTEKENTITLTGTILFPMLEYKDGRLFGAYSRSGATLRFAKN